MLKPTDIARAWGVSHQYASKMIKKGCPTDSLESALEWRKLHHSKRPAPPCPKRLTRRSSQQENTQKQESERPEGTRPPASDTPLEDALLNARQAAAEAWRLLSESMTANQDDLIGVRLSVHNKALEALFKAEQSYREELERRKILVPLNEAQDLSRKGYEIILSRLSSLPPNMAPRVNPKDPGHAMDLLQTECSGIIADAQKAFL